MNILPRYNNFTVPFLIIRCSVITGCSSISTISLEPCNDPSLQIATVSLGGVPPGGPGDSGGYPPLTPGRCLNLQFLDLTDCVRLMDGGLHLIAKNSPHLRHLYLRRCINITGKQSH